LSDDVRYGKFPFGAVRWKATVELSTLTTPSGVSPPPNADSAFDELLGSVCSL
jgi:hypothetical protein